MSFFCFCSLIKHLFFLASISLFWLDRPWTCFCLLFELTERTWTDSALCNVAHPMSTIATATDVRVWKDSFSHQFKAKGIYESALIIVLRKHYALRDETEDVVVESWILLFPFLLCKSACFIFSFLPHLCNTFITFSHSPGMQKILFKATFPSLLNTLVRVWDHGRRDVKSGSICFIQEKQS